MRVDGSFRDPSGFMFTRDGQLYRQVNVIYSRHYDQLMHSGLYRFLADVGWLVSHEEVASRDLSDGGYKVLRPSPVGFISYPYEWCFSQLRDAALLTLNVQKAALDHGMSLKDASAYNVQFRGPSPVLIDTLSFEPYVEGQPWVAYRQFCQHFLAPLALMARCDIRLSQLFRAYLDGIPLDLASRLLPLRSRLSPWLLLHIHLHARSQRKFADGVKPKTTRGMTLVSLRGLVASLESAVKGLVWRAAGTEWAEYYDETNYTADAFRDKQETVAKFLDHVGPKRVWDLGANTGVFSKLASAKGAYTISLDSDPAAVERNYLACRRSGDKNLLPLVMDLTNPSPAIGWENRERADLVGRGGPDVALALALIHHLAIGNNLPLGRLASWLSRLAPSLIIEFVPKEDSQVQRLLASREDIFPDYSRVAFEREFSRHFHIRAMLPVKGSERAVYLMERT